VIGIQTSKLEFLVSEPTTITELPLCEPQLGQDQTRCSFDKQALELSLIEDLQRQGLSEFEELEGVLDLLAVQLELSKLEVVKLLYRMDNEQKGKVKRRELGFQKASVVEALFEQLGHMTWSSFVSMRLPLLKLQDDLKAALRSKEIRLAHARLLMRVQNTFQRQAWTERTIQQSLSAKQLLMHLQPNQKPQKHHAEIPDLKARAKRLSKQFQKQHWNNAKTFLKAKKIIDSLETLLNTEASGAIGRTFRATIFKLGPQVSEPQSNSG
jgi:ParB family transcriptional regulator, chromosome partitioning protein